MQDLAGITRITFPSSSVTLEPGGEELIVSDGWIATYWEQGLPVARKPVPVAEVQRLLSTYPHHCIAG